MKLRSLEMLREYVKEQYDGNWIGRDVCLRVKAFADDAQAEVDERYLELPADADGVPIHIGDEMDYDDYRFKVAYVGDAMVKELSGFCYQTRKCRHVKKDAVVTLLEEYALEWSESPIGEEREIADKYAERIRKAVSGE